MTCPRKGLGVLLQPAQQLQMEALKSLEMMSGMILNQLQPKSAAK